MEELSENYLNNIEDADMTYAPSYYENIDTEAPLLNVTTKTYKIKANERLNLLEGVTASDLVDGDLTDKIVLNTDGIDFSKPGVKKIEYSVSDTAGNVATEIAYVTVKKDNTNIIKLGQVGIFIVSVLLFLFISRYIRSLRLEKRFSKYTINSSKNKSISLFDNLYIQYIDFINKLSKKLNKSVFIKKHSMKYENYVSAFDIENNLVFMSKKIVLGFIFIVLTIIIELLQSKLANSLEMLIAYIIGFYTLDIIYIYKYSRYKKRIENDMFDAIIIMNNAFKSGMSITQAINLVSKEIKGPISKEFQKISTDISMGLDIELAFKRFSNRVKTDEAVYLSSSLSVLNKTGGNIIKVFNSIEKNMFNRKRLENELKSLTSSSKLVMYVLIVIPPLFIFFVNMINKDYFKPLLNNILGIVLLLIMILLYTTYIIVVRKVLKVRGIK